MDEQPLLKLIFQTAIPDIWLVGKTVTIGRDTTANALVLDDQSIQPQHAKLTFESGRYFVHCEADGDAYINGQPASGVAIEPGDRIRFGAIDCELVESIANEDTPWSLIGISGQLLGREYPLFQPNQLKATLGRSKKCDVAFPGTQLSKEHAHLKPMENGLHIKDLDSSLGIFINDERVHEGLLIPTDSLRIDIHNFIVRGPSRKFAKPADNSADANLDISSKNGETAIDKQWITRPTSPGNRIEPEEPKSSSTSLIIFSVIMIAILCGIAAYLFVE